MVNPMRAQVAGYKLQVPPILSSCIQDQNL